MTVRDALLFLPLEQCLQTRPGSKELVKTLPRRMAWIPVQFLQKVERSCVLFVRSLTDILPQAAL